MDVNTIEGSLSFAQLLTKFREAYKEIKKNVIKLKKAKSKEKIDRLEEAFKYTRFAEALAKRLTAKTVQEALLIAQNISNQINGLRIENERQIAEIEAIFDRLVKILENVDRNNLIENRKSGDLVRWDRGVIDKIKAIKAQSVAVARNKIAMQQNLLLQRYRKAA